MRRIYITGGPGAGKSTLALTISRSIGLPIFELDGQALAHIATLGMIEDYEALALARQAESSTVAAGNEWIAEGSNVTVAAPFLERAEVIVVLYCSWRIASYRILMRHLKADLSRNNRFPGYRRLYRFWRWSSRYYSSRNPHGLNEWGTPCTKATLEEALQPFEHKLVRCHTRSDVRTFVNSLLVRDAEEQGEQG